MNSRCWAAVGGCVGLAAALSGCGQGESAAPAGAAVVAQKPASQAPAVKVSEDNPCSVMLPSEVGEILGRPSELREIVDEVTCHYHFIPAAQPPKGGDDETFIEVKIHREDGRTAVTAARLTAKVMGGASGGFEALTEVGDEAWLAPMASYLAFRKGDIGVEIDMRMLPGERDKAIRLARLIASRL